MTTPTSPRAHATKAASPAHVAATLFTEKTATPARIFSTFQQAIFADVQKGQGHTIVEAGPGSGKTTTMLASLDHIPKGKRVILLAFSNKIRDELKARAPKRPGITVLGLNQLGMRACVANIGGDLEVNEGKVPSILEDLVDARLPRYLAHIKAEAEAEKDPDLSSIAMATYEDERWQYLRTARKIVGLCKATLSMKAEEISRMLDDRSVDLPSDAPTGEPGEREGQEDHAEEDRAEMIRLCRRVLEISWEERKKGVDFDDQIWLPVVMKMRLPQFDYVLIESQ